MDQYFNIELNGEVNLSYYEKILNGFPQWVQFKREIRITNLLEGKRIQYDIDDINTANNALFGILNTENTELGHYRLDKACFAVKSISFIINGEKVDSLKIRIKVLTTENGKILKSLIDSNMDIEIKQYIIEEEVQYFYVYSIGKYITKQSA